MLLLLELAVVVVSQLHIALLLHQSSRLVSQDVCYNDDPLHSCRYTESSALLSSCNVPLTDIVVCNGSFCCCVIPFELVVCA